MQEAINTSWCGNSRVQTGKTVLFATPILHYPPLGGPDLRIDSSIKALSRVSKVHVYCRTDLASIGGPGTLKFYERYAQKCYHLAWLWQYFLSSLEILEGKTRTSGGPRHG